MFLRLLFLGGLILQGSLVATTTEEILLTEGIIDRTINHLTEGFLNESLNVCECDDDCIPIFDEAPDGWWTPPEYLFWNETVIRSFRIRDPKKVPPFSCPSSSFHEIEYNETVVGFPKIVDRQGTISTGSTTGPGGGGVFSKMEYCVFRRSTLITFKICQPTPLTTPPLKEEPQQYIQKCCLPDQIMDSRNPRKCINVTKEPRWVPTFYKDGHKISDADNIPPNPGKIPTHYGLPNCTSLSYFIQSSQHNKYPNLQVNGSVVIVDEKERKNTLVLAVGQFCIDGITSTTTDVQQGQQQMADESVSIEKNHSIGENYVYSGSEWHQGVIVCWADPDVQMPDWIPRLYAAVNHTAALFLMLTAIVYVLLWPALNVHGWLQFAYAVSLFFAFSLLAVVQVWSQDIFEYSTGLCYNLGWLIHFAILSSFFWLTSMNFDLWWRFSGRRWMMTLRIRSKPCRENLRRFCAFALFSIGIPVAITGTAVLLDRLLQAHDDTSLIIKLPKFGAKKCYFQDKKSQFPFLYLPIGVLLLINLIFFSSTVVNLRKLHTNTELARSNSTLEDKKGVRLIAKLFVVMGVLWIFEFISWAANMFFPGSEKVLIWVFMPTEILNSLQGVAIFVIFVCKPNVLSQLSNKFGGAFSGR